MTLKKTGAGKMFMDGLALLKTAYDKHGPGSGAKQLSTTVSLMDEKQSEQETPEDFADRMENINTQSDTPIAEKRMCQFYIRGLLDPDLKKYLIQQQLLKQVVTLSALKDRRA